MNHQLIIGCGYLGQSLFLRLIADGVGITITNRSGEVPAVLKSEAVNCLAVDCNTPKSWKNLECIRNESLDIYMLLPPSQIDPQRFTEFNQYLANFSARRVVMTSSTVVYPTSGDTINADSEVDIKGERAERQYRLENIMCSIHPDLRIVRLAGLYGPGRIIGKNSIANGEVLRGKAASWLNLIRIEDAANLLYAVMNSSTAANIELGCDGMPVRRKDYYQALADALGTGDPIFEDIDDNFISGRLCDNTPTCERTGWSPAYKDFRDVFKEC